MTTLIPQKYEAKADLGALIEHPSNPRRGDMDALAGPVETNGFYGAIVAQRSTGRVLAGNHRHRHLRANGVTRGPVIWLDVDDDTAMRILLADNRTGDLAGYDDRTLADLLTQMESLDGTGYTGEDVEEILARLTAEQQPDGHPGVIQPGDGTRLAERWIVPPLSVLDGRQGYWRDRKEAWNTAYPALNDTTGRVNIGAKHFTALADREDPVSKYVADRQGAKVSIFDPVLAEVAYHWWTRPDALIYDPFAGGPARGVVARHLGRRYHGQDIRPEQVKTNQALYPQWADSWVCADSTTTAPPTCDFIFTCPPYGDLEVYSDNPGDISNKAWGEFCDLYREALRRAGASLATDRFASIVVGNYKDNRNLRDMVTLTIEAMEAAGLTYYADTIQVMPVGVFAILSSGAFPKTRRPMNTHQYLLTFLKGNVKKAVAYATDPTDLPPIDPTDPPAGLDQ